MKTRYWLYRRGKTYYLQQEMTCTSQPQHSKYQEKRWSNRWLLDYEPSPSDNFNCLSLSVLWIDLKVQATRLQMLQRGKIIYSDWTLKRLALLVAVSPLTRESGSHRKLPLLSTWVMNATNTAMFEYFDHKFVHSPFSLDLFVFKLRKSTSA